MKLGKLIAAIKTDLPVTPRHEAWLASNATPTYSAGAKSFLAAEIGKEQRDRTRSFSASSAGSCHRRRVLAWLGVPESRGPSSRLVSIFHNGTYMHLRWQLAGLSAGWLAAPEVFAGNAHLNLKGTLDGVLDTGEGLELKSINSYGFSYLMSAGKPKAAHVYQITAYFLMTEIERFSVIYENKDTQDYREFVVTRKDAPVAQAIEEFERLNYAVDFEELPEVKDACWAGEGTEYLQCPFRDNCPTIRSWSHAQELALIPHPPSPDSPAAG